MTSHAHTLSPRHEARRLEMLRFGFGVFLLSEATIFVTLFSVRFVLAGLGHPASLNQWLAAGHTLLIVVGAVPAVGALQAARSGDAAALSRRLLAVSGIALLLLLSIAAGWGELTVPGTGRYASALTATLAIDAVHLAGAVLLFAGLAVSAARGRFLPADHFPVEAAVWFWLFLGVVWIGLYTVFYAL